MRSPFNWPSAWSIGFMRLEDLNPRSKGLSRSGDIDATPTWETRVIGYAERLILGPTLEKTAVRQPLPTHSQSWFPSTWPSTNVLICGQSVVS
jgi:hypothetical protein